MNQVCIKKTRNAVKEPKLHGKRTFVQGSINLFFLAHQNISVDISGKGLKENLYCCLLKCSNDTGKLCVWLKKDGDGWVTLEIWANLLVVKVEGNF